MAHRKMPLSSAPGWHRQDGDNSVEREQKRTEFLSAAFDASEGLRTSYLDLRHLITEVRQQLMPHARSGQGFNAAEELIAYEIEGRKNVLIWDSLVQDVILSYRAYQSPGTTDARTPNWPTSVRETIFEYFGQLLRIRDAYNLKPSHTTTDASPDDWVCESIHNALVFHPHDEVPQFGIRLQQLSFPHRSPGRHLSVKLREYTGNEPEADWYSRTMEDVDSLLREHLRLVKQKLRSEGYVEIRKSKSRGTVWLRRAARWQVLGQSWDEFIENEHIQDHDAGNRREAILKVLSFVGIEARESIPSS